MEKNATCKTYVAANAGCGASRPTLAGVPNPDAKWVFDPVPSGSIYRWYIRMNVSESSQTLPCNRRLEQRSVGVDSEGGQPCMRACLPDPQPQLQCHANPTALDPCLRPLPPPLPPGAGPRGGGLPAQLHGHEQGPV